MDPFNELLVGQILAVAIDENTHVGLMKIHRDSIPLSLKLIPDSCRIPKPACPTSSTERQQSLWMA